MAIDFQYEVDQIIAEWRGRLDLSHWSIEVSWDEPTHQATCVAEPQYLTAKISFNEDRLEREINTRKDLEELVVHELVHCRLWALANLFMHKNNKKAVEFLEEETASQLTGALIRTKYNEH